MFGIEPKISAILSLKVTITVKGKEGSIYMRQHEQFFPISSLDAKLTGSWL